MQNKSPTTVLKRTEAETIVMNESTSAAGEVVRFPLERRRDPLFEEVERLLRQRWQSVLEEPIPGHLLAALSRLERMERDRQAMAGAPPPDPST